MLSKNIMMAPTRNADLLWRRARRTDPGPVRPAAAETGARTRAAEAGGGAAARAREGEGMADGDGGDWD